MKILVTTRTDFVFTLEVSEDLELENFKAFCEAESGFPASQIAVMFNGQLISDDKKPLKDFGFKDGDMVLIERILTPEENIASIDFSSIRLPNSRNPTGSSSSLSSNPQLLRDMLLNDPHQMALIRQNNPSFAEAIESGDLTVIADILRRQDQLRAEREREQIRLKSADPFDLEAQKRIADQIRLENVDANMEAAMEHNPESFATVVMLYINCKVNNSPVKAFVDSGAQATIMSKSCAERCNIMHLVDTRYKGIAKGVGTQTIIGRVHLGQIQIEAGFFANPFSILEEQPMDMLLGLDFLRRHQCVIDLNRGKLVIGTTGAETPFLPESELPECARWSTVNEDQALAKAMEDSSKSSQPGSSGTAQVTESNAGMTSEDKFTEQDVQAVIKHGFPRSDAIKELRKFNGDVTQATASLFAKSLKL